MAAADAVTVAFVHSNEVAHSWQASFMALLGHDMAHDGHLIEGGWLDVKYGTDGLVGARNWAVERFLSDDRADWLWFVDTDMGFAPDIVDQLLDVADPSERPIVGALCFAQKDLAVDGMGGFRTAVIPTIYEWVSDGQRKGFQSVSQYPIDALVRCAGTGSAAILIHRSVYEAIREKYGPAWYDRAPNPSRELATADESRPGSGRLMGEDLSFCLRAGSLDIPIHVHTGVKTTHLKQHWIGEQDYAQQMYMQQATRPQSPGNSGQAIVAPGMAESRYTSPREDCPHPERWHSTDPDSTEFEVSELVAAMVTALQPDLVLETGTAFGQTAELIGRALARNGQGRLVTLEVDPERVDQSRERCKGLPVTVEQIASLDYTPDGPVDFAFFDSLTHLRPDEFRNWLPFMHERTVVGFHDTGPQHVVRALLEPLEKEGVLAPLYLPTPRGVMFARVIPSPPQDDER